MARPRRTNRPDAAFEDPLKDYSKPDYHDPIVEGLCEATMRDLTTWPVTVVDPETTVGQTVMLMAERHVGSVMVGKDGKLLGMLSERDVLDRISVRFDAVKDHPIVDHMTPEPVVVYETDSPAQALNLMAVGGFRHIPVLDVDERIMGMVGPQRMREFVEALYQQAG